MFSFVSVSLNNSFQKVPVKTLSLLEIMISGSPCNL
uniref:Uncharacterized protein n=1 Tax=Arundo donax TaxID=35708 RepID=A0A0A9BVV1_ARUDO